MQYSVAVLEYSFAEEWERDIFEQSLADIGFEAFDADKAYIQTNLLDEKALSELVNGTDGVRLVRCERCPDENWNAAWEEEHPSMELPMGVTITPHCAFGAGYHETTGMMVDELLADTENIIGKDVLDNGCGTGVLAIMAKKLGADKVAAIDIDDKSVTCAKENALANGTEIQVEQGCVPKPGEYDLILSNIHRNILIEQMPLYRQYLRQNGELWMSGFYETDIHALTQRAEECGLETKKIVKRGEWRMIIAVQKQ